MQAFFFAVGKIILGNGRNYVGKEMHKIALKSEVKGNTQSGKSMKKYVLACLIVGIFNYLSNSNVNDRRKRQEEKSSLLIPKPHTTK